MKLKFGATDEDEKHFHQVLVPAINKAAVEITARLNKNDFRHKDEMLRKLYGHMALLYEKVEQPNYLTMQLGNLIANIHMRLGVMFMSDLITKGK